MAAAIHQCKLWADKDPHFILKEVFSPDSSIWFCAVMLLVIIINSENQTMQFRVCRKIFIEKYNDI